MKHATKKALSLLLALALAMTFVLPGVQTAHAAEDSYSITSYSVLSYYGGTPSNYWFELSNGSQQLHGICAEPSANPGSVGSTVSLDRTDDFIRGLAYYASQTSDPDELYAIHHVAADHIGLNNGAWPPRCQWYEDNAAANAANAPASFVAYITTKPADGGQIMLVWGDKPTGNLTLTKSSANSALTDGNSCHSLADAVYGVYASEADARSDSGRVGTLTTNADGSANTIQDLQAATYYLRELTAPRGYALNPSIVSVKVEAGKTATAKVTDYPQSDPVGVLLRKVDASTPDGSPAAGLTLEGAEYTVKYYDGLYGTAEEAEASGAATRTWVFKTDSDGEIEFHADWKISGDDFYFLNGVPTLPIGTVVIQETKAPVGYQLDPTVYVVQIRSDGASEELIQSYNAPTSSEEPEETPELHTTATVDGEHVALATESVTLVDVVEYSKVIPGREYTVKGKLMDKETGEAVTGPDGEEITAEATFTPEQPSGSVEVTFTFNAVALAGHSTVVFEDLYSGERLLVSHADISDEDQTVHFPEVKTTATVDGSHVALATESVTLVDVVAYENLIPGKEYTVKGRLMNKETGKVFTTTGGKEITAEATFTPEQPDGTVEVTFTFNAVELAGHTTVVFEDLYQGDILVAAHADISDEDQTVHFPNVKTTATVDGKHKATPAESVTLVDVVKYENLIPGKEYTVKGALMIQETGEALLDKNGKPVTAEAAFVPEEASGTVELSFTFDASDLGGKSVVAFEEVYENDRLLAVHADINDKDQTVEFPKNPNTGDTANVGLWAALMAGSGSACAAAVWFAKRRKRGAEDR